MPFIFKSVSVCAAEFWWLQRIDIKTLLLAFSLQSTGAAVLNVLLCKEIKKSDNLHFLTETDKIRIALAQLMIFKF